MSETTTLADVLKGAVLDSNPGTMYALMTDNAGTLKRVYGLAPHRSLSPVTDANAAPVGWSRTSNGTVNLPASGQGGFLLAMNYDGAAGMQVFFQFDSGGPFVWMRRQLSLQWQDWKRLAFAT